MGKVVSGLSLYQRLLLVAVTISLTLAYVLLSRKRRRTRTKSHRPEHYLPVEVKKIEAPPHRVEQDVLQQPQEEQTQPPEIEWQPQIEPLAQAPADYSKAEQGHLESEQEAQPKPEQAEQDVARIEPPKRKRLEPGKRGGRPRVAVPEPRKQRRRKSTSVFLKPEIVCWKRERQWIPAVELPEQLLEYPDVTVLQNARALKYDEGYWPLEYVVGDVIIQWTEDGVDQQSRVALGEDSLLFKLTGPDQKQGRRVKSPSSGSYLVIAPEAWERDESIAGPPLVSPEAVSIEGYRGHLFDLERHNGHRIAFRTPEGKTVLIESKAPQLEWIGNQLNDAHRDIGPLFGETLPRIRAPDSQTWRDIKTIVVGEEGPGRGKWRRQFRPVPDQDEQTLPPEVAARKRGWYFLRFYDANDDLVESLDFRFTPILKEIIIPQVTPLPGENGHEPVVIVFRHTPGCKVKPDNGAATNVLIEHQPEMTLLTVPPDPALDETYWLVYDEDGWQVKVSILVERVWWGLGEENSAPSEWKDRALTLSRRDLTATSRAALWLRFPAPRWTDKVLIGFEEQKARTFPVRATERTVAIPLREFVDSPEVADRDHDHRLKLWLNPQVFANIAILPKSRLRCAQEFCDYVAYSKEEMVAHIEASHVSSLIRPLDYAELRAEYDPSLPSVIFRCLYCGYYIPADDKLVNPTSAITRHIENDCPKVDRSRGSPLIKFEPVRNVAEIRRHVMSHLPHIEKCKLCEKRFTNPTKEDRIQHLREQHLSRLFKYE